MDVKLPPLGEGADSGVVVSLLVKEGDEIKKGQYLLELETGKAVAPIPSPAAGKVGKILVKEGAKISVGTPLLSLTGANGAAESSAPAKPGSTATKPAAKKSRPSAPEPEEQEEEVADDDYEYEGENTPPASPSLRRLARDLGINLRKIQGSEQGGRIVLADFKSYIQRLQKLAAKNEKSAAVPASSGQPVKPVEQIDFSRFGAVTKKPMTSLRKVISQRMTENWNAIPHVTQFDEVDITGLMELRKKHADSYEKQGAKLTLTPFTLKAVVNALKKHPIFNSSLDEVAEEIVFKEYFHIGLAVDTEQGLIVPVVRDVDKKNLITLSKEVNQLAEKARDRKVSMEELQGGSFTISNQGGIGGAHFTPIVNKPEVAILGIGKASLKAMVTKDKQIQPRLMMPLCLSYDHRVVDGGSAARFITDLVQAFEAFTDEEVKL
jgi:pyruvate dehydrogenase E2 component (dihydrolipoamide acetyltransferase)